MAWPWTSRSGSLPWFTHYWYFLCISSKVLIWIMILSWIWAIRNIIIKSRTSTIYMSRSNSFFWKAIIWFITSWSRRIISFFFFWSTFYWNFLRISTKIFIFMIFARANSSLWFTRYKSFTRFLSHFVCSYFFLCSVSVWIIFTRPWP
jgi:hypothetical protein